MFGGGGGVKALQVSGLEGYQLNVGVDLEKYGDNNSSRLFFPLILFLCFFLLF